MKNKLKVYIASPYTNGWQASNVRLQIDAFHILLENGFQPFIPLLGHFVELIYPQKESNYTHLEWDISWLEECDMVARIWPKDENGNIITSSGADAEQKRAEELNIPIAHFEDLDELKRFFSNPHVKNGVKNKLQDKVTSHFEKILGQ